MNTEEFLDDESEWADTEGYEGAAWYVTDINGIVAGSFDSQDEAAWWISKSIRL